jgi:hypothetical protein
MFNSADNIEALSRGEHVIEGDPESASAAYAVALLIPRATPRFCLWEKVHFHARL